MSTQPPPSGESDGTVRIADLPEEERQKVQSMLRHKAALHEHLALELVEIGARHAVISMPIRSQALNSMGNLHGGAIATLIDVAAGAAAAQGSAFQQGVQSLVTVDLHVRYLGRPRGEMVYARAEVIKAGRQLVIVGCQVTDTQERVIASADFSMMIVSLRQPLRPVDGTTDTDLDL